MNKPNFTYYVFNKLNSTSMSHPEFEYDMSVINKLEQMTQSYSEPLDVNCVLVKRTLDDDMPPYVFGVIDGNRFSVSSNHIHFENDQEVEQFLQNGPTHEKIIHQIFQELIHDLQNNSKWLDYQKKLAFKDKLEQDLSPAKNVNLKKI